MLLVNLIWFSSRGASSFVVGGALPALLLHQQDTEFGQREEGCEDENHDWMLLWPDVLFALLAQALPCLPLLALLALLALFALSALSVLSVLSK